MKKIAPPRLPAYDEKDEKLIHRLSRYLNDVIEIFSASPDQMEKVNVFLEVAKLRNEDAGKIIKNGWCGKAIGGRYKSNKITQFIKNNFAFCWKKKWFILSEEGIGYTNEYNQKEFRDILFYDTTLRVRFGMKSGDEDTAIVLFTSSRKLKLKVDTTFEMFDWLQALAESISRSPYCKINRYTSFCPITSGNMAESYINAHKYYEDLANDLEKAEHEIYITDWWMSPEVYLKRPIPVDAEGRPTSITYRLDQILFRAAQRGCKIFILLYREFEHALPNKSAYTQQRLMDLHANIEVVRHPGDLIFLWSHHEKIVVIDQHLVYLGGLDLCYGRYDMDNYPLCEPNTTPGHIYFPGQDYSNVRIKDFSNVDQFDLTLIDRNTTPRMPWRDIAVKLQGPVTKHVTRHFIQYWNFAKSDLEGNDRKNFLMKKNFEIENGKQKKPKPKYNASSIVKKVIAEKHERQEKEREQRDEEEIPEAFEKLINTPEGNNTPLRNSFADRKNSSDKPFLQERTSGQLRAASTDVAPTRKLFERSGSVSEAFAGPVGKAVAERQSIVPGQEKTPGGDYLRSSSGVARRK